MDALAVTLYVLQVLFLCSITEPVHAQDGTIDNINVTAVASNILARIGRNSGMRCTFSPSYPQDAEVYWRRDDGTRLTEGRTSVFDRRRFRARVSGSRDSYGLFMRRVRRSDTGIYFCGLQLNGVVKEARVNFTVVVPESERGNTSIRARNEQVEGRIGGMAGMSCSYRPRYPEHTQFYWRKEDGTRVATGESVVYESDRISASMRTMSPSYGLVIRNLTPSDNGVYVCGFEQNGRVGEARMTLRVLTPPRILRDESSYLSLTARAGADIDIRCIASGTPTPNITWTSVTQRDSGELLRTAIGHGPILTLHNVRRSNISYYRCLADNGIRPTTSKIFFVEVSDPPVVSIQNPRVEGMPGSFVVLNCDILSNPMGQSSWIFEGQPVTNSSTHTVRVNYRSSEELTFSLGIRSLSESDLGQYTCQASNSIGTASGTIDLVGNTRPARRSWEIFE